jgi:hypothetical protein
MDTDATSSDQPDVGYFLAGEPSQAPMSLTEIHGDKWCVLGDRGVSDLTDDALVYSKLEVFGLPLAK